MRFRCPKSAVQFRAFFHVLRTSRCAARRFRTSDAAASASGRRERPVLNALS